MQLVLSFMMSIYLYNYVYTCIVLIKLYFADEIASPELHSGMLIMIIFGLFEMVCLQEKEDQR